MEDFGPLMLMAPLFMLILAVVVAKHRRQQAAWAAFAARHGLALSGQGAFSNVRAEGVIDGMHVVVHVFSRGSGKSQTWYTQWQVLGVAPGLSAAAEGGFLNFFRAADLEIGDPSFDDAVRLGGEEGDLRAALDAPIRQALTRFVGEDGDVEAGTVQVTKQVYADKEPQLEVQLEAALAMARKLRAATGDTATRLACIAREDTHADVRLGALKALATRHPGHPEIEDAAEALLTDRSPAVRSAATLIRNRRDELAALVRDPGAPPEDRREAMKRLSKPHEDHATRVAAMDAALSSTDPLLVGIAVRRAAAEPGLVPVARLRSAAARLVEAIEIDGASAALLPLIQGLPAWGGAEDEGWLVDVLRTGKRDVGLAAMGAMERVAGVSAVEPLLGAEKEGVPFGEWRGAARRAVDAIQERAGTAAPGGLSVAGSVETGALSEADPGEDDRGRLSAARRAMGRQS